MSVGEKAGRLCVDDEDLQRIRRARNSNALLMTILGFMTAVVSFIIGYLSYEGQQYQNYPYALSGLALTSAKWPRRRAYLVVVILGFLAFASFLLGSATARHSNYGVGSYYGVCAKKA